MSPFPAGGLHPVLPLRVLTDGLGEGQGARPRSSPKQWQNERASPLPFPGEERSREAAGPPGQVASSWLATQKALEVVTTGAQMTWTLSLVFLFFSFF